MPIFSNSEEMTPEQRKKRNVEQRKKMGITAENTPFAPEKGVEELDLEEVVPGGSYLSMVAPTSLGRKALQAGVKKFGKAMAKETAGEAGERLARETSGSGVLEKLSDRMPDKPSKLDYGAMEVERKAGRKAAEEAAPTIDYAKINAEDEAKKQVKRKKIKQGPDLEYGGQIPTQRPRDQ